jgi:RHS repeat-associated protein
MQRVLSVVLLIVGLAPATLHAAPAPTYGVIDARADLASSYFGARYYASGNGRFISVDPVLDVEQALVDPQRWNRYTYVRNNPFRYVDPDGRAIETLWDVASLGMSLHAVWQNPTSVWNWVSVGADVVSVAGPGIPAIGMAIREAVTMSTAQSTSPREQQPSMICLARRLRPTEMV